MADSAPETAAPPPAPAPMPDPGPLTSGITMPQVSEPEPEPQADEWAAFGDDAEELRAKYRHPSDLAKAYREAEAAMTRSQQEAADWRRYYESQNGQQVQQQAEPEPGIDVAALIRQAGGCVTDEGELDADALGAIFQLHEQSIFQRLAPAIENYIAAQFEAYNRDVVAPMATEHQIETVGREIDALQGVYGDAFDAVGDEAERLLREDEATYSAMSVRALYAEAAANLTSRQQEGRRRESEAVTIPAGGRPVRPTKLSTEEAELRAQEAIMRSRSHGL